ncbi:MAG: dephospho-CoA kinase [Acidimicrobiales bacterium]
MIEIGLTGGIGSGKSSVADALVARGAVLIDADRIVHELQSPGTDVFEAMVQRWGERIVAPDGTLDRAEVAGVVFSDPDELEVLEAIVHPAVGREIATRRAALEGTDAVVVLDIPLLVRGADEPVRDEYRRLAGIIVVDVDPEVAVDRLVRDRGFDERDVRDRLANQVARDVRLARADFVIDNNGDRDALEEEVGRCWAWIEGLSASRHPAG